MNKLTSKIYWNDIKLEIQKINPAFFKAVETVSPGSDHPIYLLKFPFGELLGDEVSQFIPFDKNEYLRLTDPCLPSELKKDLGYGAGGSPLGMLLDKNLEWFVDLPYKGITIPMALQQPGTFFSYTKVLDLDTPYNYSPMGLMSLISGARSIFFLPSIGHNIKLTKLKRALEVKCKPPMKLYEHFDIFKTILSSKHLDNNWSSSVLYFSEPWIHDIRNNPEWYEIQKYFYKNYAESGMFLRSLPKYNLSLSLILDKLSQRSNLYLLDTFRHLLFIMSGEMPGFSPQVNESLCPVEIIQDCFIKYYGLKDTVPTIIGPSVFNPSNPKSPPVYYSLQFPTSNSFSPKPQKSSLMTDLRTLAETSSEILSELSKDNEVCSNTIIQNISRDLNVSFFHNSNDIDQIITPISNILLSDNRFSHLKTNKNSPQPPSKDGKFFRGCVQIKHKNS